VGKVVHEAEGHWCGCYTYYDGGMYTQNDAKSVLSARVSRFIPCYVSDVERSACVVKDLTH